MEKAAAQIGQQGGRAWTLAGVADLGVLRGQLRAYMAEQGVSSPTVADIILATQEAAKNAVCASSGRLVTVRVFLTDAIVWVSVQDEGRGFAQTASRRCPGIWSTHGRGLCLMHTLMDDVEITHRHGTRVVMRRHFGDRAAS